jgi:phosphatidylserine/phosphatidylglycerophosphate/cardiolipin synthase-like enzyme
MASDVAVISEASLSCFSDVAFANRRRIRRAWLISPWIGSSQSRGDPVSYLVEALCRCHHVWLITRPPIEAWHAAAVGVLRANSKPTVLFNSHLHAKLYILDCDGFQYALLGSPNLTPRANTTNKELAIEFRTSLSSRADKIAGVIHDLIAYAQSLLTDPESLLQSEESSRCR